MSDEPTEFGLVMPFVCTVTNGGPYDDRSFVAGAQMQAVWGALEAMPAEHEVYAPPALVGQLDLVAMHHGYRMTSEPWADHPDEWTLCRFVPVGTTEQEQQQ